MQMAKAYETIINYLYVDRESFEEDFKQRKDPKEARIAKLSKSPNIKALRPIHIVSITTTQRHLHTTNTRGNYASIK